ncbi:Uncharacterised protein [Brucella anthropi]|jgi:hypothetical protein|nr:Uncharacterised protein [Brucella anthropi]
MPHIIPPDIMTLHHGLFCPSVAKILIAAPFAADFDLAQGWDGIRAVGATIVTNFSRWRTFAHVSLLQSRDPQPGGVRDDAHRRQRHGGGRDDRRQQDVEERVEHPGRHRHAERVVNEGEE